MMNSSTQRRYPIPVFPGARPSECDYACAMVNAISWYNANADEISERYEQVDPECIRGWPIDLLPSRPPAILVGRSKSGVGSRRLMVVWSLLTSGGIPGHSLQRNFVSGCRDLALMGCILSPIGGLTSREPAIYVLTSHPRDVAKFPSIHSQAI